MNARMYYLRDRIGKEANKVKEKRLFEAKRVRHNLSFLPFLTRPSKLRRVGEDTDQQ